MFQYKLTQNQNKFFFLKKREIKQSNLLTFRFTHIRLMHFCRNISETFCHLRIFWNFEQNIYDLKTKDIVAISTQPYRLIKQMNISLESPIGGSKLWMGYRHHINFYFLSCFFSKANVFLSICHIIPSHNKVGIWCMTFI